MGEWFAQPLFAARREAYFAEGLAGSLVEREGTIGMKVPALEWAEPGVSAFPERTDSRLREFPAKEYHSLGRHDEALALVWAGFVESSALAGHQKLKAHAGR